jgi:hypothetical protein
MTIARPRDDIRIHTHRNLYEGGPIFASSLVDDGGDPVTIVSSPEFVDSLFRIIGSSNPSKKLAFEVDGLSIGTRTLTPQDADYILAGTNIPNIFTKPQTITPDSVAVGLTINGFAAQSVAFLSVIDAAAAQTVFGVFPGTPTSPTSTTTSHIRVGRPDTGRYWWMQGGTTPDFNLDSVGNSRKLLVLNSVASYWTDTKETAEFRMGDSIASRKDAAILGRSGNPLDRLAVSSQYTVFTSATDVALPIPVGTERVRIVGKLLTDTAPQIDIASAALNTVLASADVDGNTIFQPFSSFTSAEFIDSAFRVIGSGDATRKWGLEVDGISSGNTRIATVQNLSSTLPAIGNVAAPPSAGYIGKVDLVDQAA